MINTKPSEIVHDLFEPFISGEKLFLDQSVITETRAVLNYQELDPIFKAMLLGKLYCYFLYPSFCLCDYGKKICTCRQKRIDALQSFALETYKKVFEQIEEMKKIDFNDVDIKTTINYSVSVLGMTQEQAVRNLEYLNEKNRENMRKQVQLLTGIKDASDYAHLQETLNPEAHEWFEKVVSLTQDINSYFSMAMGIGRHLLSQLDILQHRLKIVTGHKSHLSLNQIVLEVLDGKSLDFFNGIKFPKTKLVHALYMYRSILHIMLGHSAAKTNLVSKNDLDVSTLTFTIAYDFQINFLKYSKKAFTHLESKSLFTVNNLALVPHPSQFLPPQKIVHKEVISPLNPNQDYRLHVKTSSKESSVGYN